MTDQTALVLPAPAARRPVLLLIALALAGWGVLAAMVLSMPGGGAFQDFLSLCTTTTPALGWPSPAEAGSVLLMWMAMALAMMMPTAVPAAMACASAKGEGGAFSFIAGYLVVYGFFAVASSVLQLSYGALVATMPDLEGAGLALSGSVLLLGGLYQFTPAKVACLARCRRPAERF